MALLLSAFLSLCPSVCCGIQGLAATPLSFPAPPSLTSSSFPSSGTLGEASLLSPPVSNVVDFGPARFSFFSSTLVRMQLRGPGGVIDPRPSLSFPFSTASSSPIFISSTTTSGDVINITTPGIQVVYSRAGGGGFTPGSLTVALLTPPYTVWAPGAVGETLGGTRLDLGCYDTFEACYSNGLGWGPLSRQGWALWDDTNSTKMSTENEPSVGFPWFDAAQPASLDALDLYLFAQGLDFMAGLRDFARVSGPPPLPPYSAFGVWWSTWYDFGEGEFDRVVLQEYADRNLPLDVAVLDMGWHIQPHAPNCSSWGGFTWNRGLFPGAESWVAGLRAGTSPTGAPLAVLLNGHPDDGIGPCEENYTAFSRAIGANPGTRAKYPCDMANATWAGALVDTMLAPKGTSAWWTDYAGCSPPSPGRSLPLPSASGCPAAKQSNASTQELLWSNYVYSESTRVSGARPLVLSRYGGLGNQRYGIGFSGDTQSTWDTLALQVAMSPTASNVLFGYWSHDIGGYNIYCPKNGKITPCPCGTVIQPCNLTTGDCGRADAELYTRWLQFGALSPILRTHCSHCDRRIWSYPQPYYSAMAAALRLRRALQPLFYTAAANATTSLLLPVHPLYHDFPTHPQAFDAAGVEYVVGGGGQGGQQLLVAPVTAPGGGGGDLLWLPPGTWLPWACGGSCTPLVGPAPLSPPPAAIGEYRVWASAGSVLPTQPSTAGPKGSTLVWVLFGGGGQAVVGAGVGGVAAGVVGAGGVYEDDGTTTLTGALRTPLAFTHAARNPGQAAPAAAPVTSVSVGPAQGEGFPGAPPARRHVLQLRGFGEGGMPSGVVCGGETLPPLAPPPVGAGEAYNQTGWWAVPQGLAQPWLTEGALVVVPQATPTRVGLTCEVSW